MLGFSVAESSYWQLLGALSGLVFRTKVFCSCVAQRRLAVPCMVGTITLAHHQDDADGHTSRHEGQRMQQPVLITVADSTFRALLKPDTHNDLGPVIVIDTGQAVAYLESTQQEQASLQIAAAGADLGKALLQSLARVHLLMRAFDLTATQALEGKLDKIRLSGMEPRVLHLERLPCAG